MQGKKFLFLGDSFTVGTGLGEGLEDKAFPHQLIKKLRTEGHTIAYPKMYAVDGDTTKHLLGTLNSSEPQSNPDNKKIHRKDNYDMVVLSIGVNDLFRGHDIEDYAHHFKELLERAVRFANDDASRVIVLSIPAWDASPSVENGGGLEYRGSKYDLVKDKVAKDASYNTQAGVAKTIDDFNTAAQTEIVCFREKNNISSDHIKFFDITEVTRAKNGTEMFAQDGIHYSGQMYEIWADMVRTAASKIIKDTPPKQNIEYSNEVAKAVRDKMKARAGIA